MIEFYGPPGVGKTTLMEFLIKKGKKYKSLDEAYVRAVKNAFNQEEDLFLPPFGSLKAIVPKIFNTIFTSSLKITPQSLKPYNAKAFSGASGLNTKMISQFNCEYPKTIKNTTELIKSFTNDETRISYCLNWFLFLVERYMAIEKYITQKGSIIDDQGFVDFVSPILVPPHPTQNFSKKDIKNYFENIFIPDRIVFLEASAEVCLNRMKKRKPGLPPYYKTLSEEDRLPRLRKEIKCYRMTYNYLKSQDVTVIKLSTEKEKSILVRDLQAEFGNGKNEN